jgi:hypothetical protein
MVKHTKTTGIQGLSGSPGKLIFHKKSHRVVAYVAPAAGQTATTAGQLAERTLFQDAHKYAKAVQQQPEVWAKYQAEATRCHSSPVELAIADYMQGPVIQDVYLHQYRGQPGDPIRILASDGFRVAGVQVTITNGAGEAVESGPAVYKPGTADWLYKAIIVNPALPGSRIRIQAQDLPGNCTCVERRLEV